MAEPSAVQAGEGGVPASSSRPSQAEQLAARRQRLSHLMTMGRTATPPGEHEGTTSAQPRRARPVREHKWSFRRVMRGRKKGYGEARDIEDPALQGVEEEPSFWDSSATLTCLTHKDNIYTFMIFMPAYQRHRHRHYCRSGVLLAVILLALTAMLQVGLIWIAGRDIHYQKVFFTGSLVRDVRFLDYVPTTPLDELAHKGVDAVKDYVDTIQQKFAPKKEQARCCGSANCAELRLTCCDRSHLAHYLDEMGDSQDVPEDAKRIPGEYSDVEIGEQQILVSQKAVCLRSRQNREVFLDCSPPTFRFVDSWHDLDTNGDGIWTLLEARLDVANLGCKYGVPVEDLFRSACRGIIKDAEDTASNSFTIPLIPKSIENREAIPQDYYMWWTGLAALCVSTDASRCSEFVASGFFDMAMKLKDKASRGGIADLDTALDYCQRMLRPGGLCEKTMPSSYLMYRARVEDKCGARIYSPGQRHSNPFDARDVMHTVSVSYANYNQYDTAIKAKFKFFVFLILLAWYVNLVGEFMELVRFADFLWNIRVDDRFTLLTPAARDNIRRVSSRIGEYGTFSQSLGDLSKRYLETPASTPRGPSPTEIEEPKERALEPQEKPAIQSGDKAFQMIGMSYVHYYICVVTFFIRAFLWWYIMQTGTVYLMNNYQYDDLLMNAIGLAFVFEVPEAMYWFLIPDKVKAIFENARTCEYQTALPTHGLGRIIISRTFLGLIVAPPIVIMVLQFNLYHHIIPSLEALSCACFQSGDQCEISHRFTKAWWDDYWTNTSALAAERASWISSDI
mmetsp:Transcript_50037/g.88188  ORF Transcript_50037/g.88188 Transcript_50037/m.88188 type:complete len:791 (-) Transcript_50037:37-2409(-)